MIVKKVYVFVEGDPSVGIPHGYFGADVHFDLDCYDEDCLDEVITEVRCKFEEAYRAIHGGPVSITFDFEREEDPEDDADPDSHAG